jgi:ABC-2 type transport system permease protein
MSALLRRVGERLSPTSWHGGAALRAMLWKEFLQMRRDRLTFAMMLGIPTMQIIIFGFLVKTQVTDLPLVVLDESHTAESRLLAATLENTGNYRIVRWAQSRAEMETEFARSHVQAGLVIPPEYARDVKRGRPAIAQLVIDASDPLSASAGIAGAAVAGNARSAALSSAGGHVVIPAVEVRVRPRYNPALRDAVNIVPGLIGVVLTITLVMVMSLALVRERERGTLEQLIVTPISKSSVILGKILPFLLVGFVQITVILLLGRFLFDIPMRGSVTLLYFESFLFMLGMLALGLFMSTLAKNQAQAMQLALFMIMPSFLLSGFMFPLAAMPKVAQIAGSLLPVTHYLVALRGIMLKGSGLDALWPATLILAAVALALIFLSVNRFAKTLE